MTNIIFSYYHAYMTTNFFNNINGYALDEQQKEAILKAKKHSLIVAGAGSGKTLTLVGKIKYLTEIKNVKPEEILCISFTNEATRSLKEKIHNKKVNVFTFHKLALTILDKENKEYQIAPESFLEETISTFLKKEIWKNTFLKKQWQKICKKIFISKRKAIEFLYTKEGKELQQIIKTFITLYSTHGRSKKEFKKLFINKKTNSILYIIYAILNYYETEKIKKEYFDFDDLIKKATEICGQKKICHYKEIIIDEFQDTSKLRLQFILQVVKNSNANLTVVGDDFQSIYKFSGCDLNIFLHFQKYFSNAKIFKIENTYRNSQELIKAAGDFVMKNKEQIHKDLKSKKHLKKPIKIKKYGNKYKTLLKLITYINKGEILILGRNNFDIYRFIPKEKITWQENGYFRLEKKTYHLRYLTIHKSKGLESDNVIIINLENTELGLPCKRKNHFITYLIQAEENFLFEEERRLFYVALTRTKNYCYLLVPYFNSSTFIKEIKKEI